MKKLFFVFLAFLLICTTAFGASFQMEDNPNYKHPVVTSGTASSFYTPSINPVTFNNRSLGNDNFHGGFNAANASNYSSSWVSGPSGEANDYAFCLTAKNGTDVNTGDANYAYFFYSGSVFKNRGGSMFLQFDLMLNTTTDRFKIMSMPLWGGGGIGRIIFDETGKVYGTDVPYEAKKWMNVKIESNFETSKCNMWIDGVLVKENVPATTGTWGEGTRLNVYMDQVTVKSPGEDVAGYAIDNIYAYVVGSDISDYVTMRVASSDGTLYEINDAPVNPVIELTFPSDLNTELLNNENILLQNKNGNLIPCILEVDTASACAYIIPQRKLSFGENYNVKLSDEIRKGCKSANPPVGKLTFTTGNNRDIVISDFSISSSVAGSSAIVSATLTNNTGATYDTGIMIAVYNKNGGLSAIKRVNLNLESGVNWLDDELSLALPDDYDSQSEVKLFVTPANDYSVIHEMTLE